MNTVSKMEKEIDFANGELSDSELLRKLAEWHESHISLGVSPDLRRIASDLEKREAPSDEDEKVTNYINGLNIKIRDCQSGDDDVSWGMEEGILISKKDATHIVIFLKELTAALASRDYYKELAEAADKIVEYNMKGSIYSTDHSPTEWQRIHFKETFDLIEKWQHLKNNPPEGIK